MKYLYLFLLGFSFCTFAEQKLNPATGKFETVRPGSQLKYNPMEDEWKYVPPNSQLQYNPLTDRFDMAPKEYVNKYNAMEGQWEKTHPDSQLKMNPSTGDFQYVPPGSKLEFNPFSIEMTLSPITGIHPSFIKLTDGYYIGSSELKKRGYENIIPPYNDSESKLDHPIYLEFILNIFLKSDHKDITKKDIGNIQFKKPRDDMAHNYEYDYESSHLQGNVYFDDEVFNNLYSNLIKKTFPATVDILIDQKYTKPYDHYSKPWTPWDLSSLKYSSRSHPSNDQVKIDYIYFKYDLLNTSDLEILKEREKIADELNTSEASYLWNTKNSKTEKNYLIEKNLSFISVILFIIFVILVVILIFK